MRADDLHRSNVTAPGRTSHTRTIYVLHVVRHRRGDVAEEPDVVLLRVVPKMNAVGFSETSTLIYQNTRYIANMSRP